jgi:hypothetical protein
MGSNVKATERAMDPPGCVDFGDYNGTCRKLQIFFRMILWHKHAHLRPIISVVLPELVLLP